MPETRIAGKYMPRATGIERVNQQINRPTATGAVASAHVSAAPGAGAAVHAHVMSARNPAGGPIQTRGPATRAPGSNSRQDASVQIIDRRTGGGGGGGGGFATKPTVQLLDQIPRREQEIFSVEQLNLMGSLLGQYAERVAAIGEHKDAATARDAIQKIGTMLKSNVSVNASATLAFDPPEVRIEPANPLGAPTATATATDGPGGGTVKR